MADWLDLSRTLSDKERRAFKARQKRLAGPFGKSVVDATERTVDELGAPGHLAAHGLRIRTRFAYLQKPAPPADVSDRRAPRRELRPSATRISNSKGCALRLYLTALSAAQITNRPGRMVTFDWPLVGASGEFSWTDLLASGAEATGKARTYSGVREKKGRALRSALETLDDAGLVHLPGAPGRRGRHEGFNLLDEAGRQLKGDPVEYRVPTNYRDDYFTLPAEFVTNGWIHVLEDSEITLLLMVACKQGALPPCDAADIAPGEVAMPAEVRLLHYGIARDPFSTAHRTLERFGLLNVREIDRHEDGRAEDADTRLHRLSLNYPDRNATDPLVRPGAGFAANALSTVQAEIDACLAR